MSRCRYRTAGLPTGASLWRTAVRLAMLGVAPLDGWRGTRAGLEPSGTPELLHLQAIGMYHCQQCYGNVDEIASANRMRGMNGYD